MQTPTDPSLAPAGKHILSIFAQYFPYGAALHWNANEKRAVVRTIIESWRSMHRTCSTRSSIGIFSRPPDIEARSAFPADTSSMASSCRDRFSKTGSTCERRWTDCTCVARERIRADASPAFPAAAPRAQSLPISKRSRMMSPNSLSRASARCPRTELPDDIRAIYDQNAREDRLHPERVSRIRTTAGTLPRVHALSRRAHAARRADFRAPNARRSSSPSRREPLSLLHDRARRRAAGHREGSDPRRSDRHQLADRRSLAPAPRNPGICLAGQRAGLRGGRRGNRRSTRRRILRRRHLGHRRDRGVLRLFEPHGRADGHAPEPRILLHGPVGARGGAPIN